MLADSRTTTYFLYPLFFTFTIIKADPSAFGCGSIASDEPYQDALFDIMGALYLRAPAPGFSTKIIGDAVGYALCRGDVNYDDCSNCVYQAGNEILGQCLKSTDAFIYYDYCYITYLTLEHTNKFVYDSNIYYCSHSDVHVSAPVLFYGILNHLFGAVAASAQLQRRLIGAAYTELGDSYVLYGYAQCFNDISAWDCKACIDSLTAQVPNTCVYGYAGGRLVGGTCILRFEIYYFLNW